MISESLFWPSGVKMGNVHFSMACYALHCVLILYASSLNAEMLTYIVLLWLYIDILGVNARRNNNVAIESYYRIDNVSPAMPRHSTPRNNLFTRILQREQSMYAAWRV